MVLLATLHGLINYAGPLVLQPLLEAMNHQRAELLANGQTLLIARLFGPALASFNQSPGLATRVSRQYGVSLSTIGLTR
jgi:hypothetical protein